MRDWHPPVRANVITELIPRGITISAHGSSGFRFQGWRGSRSEFNAITLPEQESTLSLERLIEAVPPPATLRGGAHDWPVVEADLGWPLPNDYKQLVDTYAPGVFGNFIHIYQPHARQEGLDLKQESEGELWSLEVLQDDGENVPYQLEDPAELLSFARTSNGDPLFWQRTDPADPDRWPIVVEEARGPEWYTFDGTLTEFLRAALLGEVSVPIFPKSFPLNGPTFTPYEQW